MGSEKLSLDEVATALREQLLVLHLDVRVLLISFKLTVLLRVQITAELVSTKPEVRELSLTLTKPGSFVRLLMGIPACLQCQLCGLDGLLNGIDAVDGGPHWLRSLSAAATASSHLQIGQAINVVEAISEGENDFPILL